MNLANFRELGGYRSKNGKKIKHNRLLRSGEVYQLDAESLNQLHRHSLTKIIDLRGEREISIRPDDSFENVTYHWIDIMKHATHNASLEDLMSMADREAVDQHMLGVYEDLVLNTDAQKGYRNYFEELLKTENGSVLFHCFAGKDRTGIAAALTLSLLDVPKETIYQDYLATNAQRQKPNALFLAEAAKRGLTEEQLAGAKIALEVKKSYLDRAYQLIAEQFGTVEKYASEVLNIGNPERELLKELYLDV